MHAICLDRVFTVSPVSPDGDGGKYLSVLSNYSEFLEGLSAYPEQLQVTQLTSKEYFPAKGISKYFP